MIRPLRHTRDVFVLAMFQVFVVHFEILLVRVTVPMPSKVASAVTTMTCVSCSEINLLRSTHWRSNPRDPHQRLDLFPPVRVLLTMLLGVAHVSKEELSPALLGGEAAVVSLLDKAGNSLNLLCIEMASKIVNHLTHGVPHLHSMHFLVGAVPKYACQRFTQSSVILLVNLLEVVGKKSRFHPAHAAPRNHTYHQRPPWARHTVLVAAGQRTAGRSPWACFSSMILLCFSYRSLHLLSRMPDIFQQTTTSRRMCHFDFVQLFSHNFPQPIIRVLCALVLLIRKC